jgi:hypothetical protein
LADSWLSFLPIVSHILKILGILLLKAQLQSPQLSSPATFHSSPLSAIFRERRKIKLKISDSFTLSFWGGMLENIFQGY